MKTKPFFLSIISLLCLKAQVSAQSDINSTQCNAVKNHKNIIVTYDLNTEGMPLLIKQYGKNEKNVQKVWYGKTINFRVKANPYLYDVFIGLKQVLDDDISDTTAGKVFASVASINKAFVSAQVAETGKTANPPPQKNDKQTTTVGDIAKTISDNRQALIQNADTALTRQIEKLKANNFTDILKENNLKDLNISDLQQLTYTSTGFQNQIELLSDVFEKIKPTIDLQSEQERQIYISNRNKFLAAIDTFNLKIDELKTFLNACEHAFSIIFTDRMPAEEIINQIDNDFKNYYSIGGVSNFITVSTYSVYSYQKNISESFKWLQQNFVQLENAKNNFTYYTKHNFTADSLLFKEYDSAYKLIALSDPGIIARTITGMLLNLQKKQCILDADIHIYPPTLITKDTIIYSLKLKSSGKYDSLIKRYNTKLYNEDSTIECKIPVKGTFKLNLSVGISFLHGDLRSSSYYFSPNRETLVNDDDKLEIKKADGNSSYRPVISAFAHAYLKLGGYFTPSITIGLSTNPSDLSNASYMLGSSLIFGQHNRFIATMGIAASSVDYLKGKYHLNQLYTKKEMSGLSETDLVEKTFKTGFFFGFSYNISSNR